MSKIKELKKSGGLTDPKLREMLEDELRKLFSSTAESDRELFEQLKSELHTERMREKFKVGAKLTKLPPWFEFISYSFFNTNL